MESRALLSGLTGAIFTTDSSGTGVDVNIYASKDDVYLDGGPKADGAAGLPDGKYFAKVTEPDGTLLGTTDDGNPLTDDAVIQVVGGEFVQLYQLSAILHRASDGGAGYDDTSNGGGEYKVWVSSTADFDNRFSKTDNFKVRKGDTPPPRQVEISGLKYYDANADGVYNAGDSVLPGWKVTLSTGEIQYTADDGTYTFLVDQGAGALTVRESMPIQPNWVQTGPIVGEQNDPLTNAVALGDMAGERYWSFTVTTEDVKFLNFGNLTLGAGGGKTLGYWSNKNGEARIGADDLELLRGLNLVNADGTPFNPTTYAQFRTWILNATATNMSYMTSAQLAAMALNVFNGLVSGSAMVQVGLPTDPDLSGVGGINANGFIAISDLMAEANALLGSNPTVLSGNAVRNKMEKLKNALDRANNNLNFIVLTVPAPGSYTFA